MPDNRYGLETRLDFQRFCAELRAEPHGLDDLVEGLRALAASSLRPRDKTRFARSLARTLSESFHEAELRAVASVDWPPEIAMALKRFAPTPEAAPSTAKASLPEPLRFERGELSLELGSPAVVLLGDEDEHRPSLPRLEQLGLHGLRVGTLGELHDALAREVVAGLVIGASWWTSEDPPGTPLRERLRRILRASNLCFIKLVRSPGWADLHDELPALYARLYFRAPPMTRLAVDVQATLTTLDLRCLIDAVRDITYAERQVHYRFQPSVAQDGLIRAVTSHYLREKFPTVHGHQAQLSVRALADRGEQGLVGLVSVTRTDVSFVVKVSPHRDAREEAQRFRTFAHGASFEMEFFCHGQLGALVFAPITTRLGDARSLQDLLVGRGLARGDPPNTAPSAAQIDSAVGALERFSRQAQVDDLSIFCTVESEPTRSQLRRCGPIAVAGHELDVHALYLQGVEVLDRCAGTAVAHGDAHPGNILFGANGAAILIDYECAGLGPAGYDLCSLWIFAMASHFLALDDEAATTALLRELLAGASLPALVRAWPRALGPSLNRDLVYLTSRALAVSEALMAEHGFSRRDLLGIVAVILGRELFNPSLQQLVVRCALAATRSLLPEPAGGGGR